MKLDKVPSALYNETKRMQIACQAFPALSPESSVDVTTVAFGVLALLYRLVRKPASEWTAPRVFGYNCTPQVPFCALELVSELLAGSSTVLRERSRRLTGLSWEDFGIDLHLAASTTAFDMHLDGQTCLDTLLR